VVYKPKQIEINTTPQQIVGYDPARDTLVLSNLTGAIMYWGVDSELSIANGAPVFNNGRVEFNRTNGRDPRISRWLVLAAGSGTVSVDEESIGEI